MLVDSVLVQKSQRAAVRGNIFFWARAATSRARLNFTGKHGPMAGFREQQKQLTNRKHMLIFTIDPGAITKISLLVFFQLQIINQKVEIQ